MGSSTGFLVLTGAWESGSLQYIYISIYTLIIMPKNLIYIDPYNDSFLILIFTTLIIPIFTPSPCSTSRLGCEIAKA